ncbi:hypothetical protein QTP88_019348 [Uroleucon formosanum]
MNDFIEEEVHLALKNVKNGKAAGVDGILPEFIKNLGPRSRLWLARFFTSVANKGTLPKAWREAKVVAILKPNKPGNDPRNYRPISLLSVIYKLFERLLLRRMSPLLDRTIPMEQAGFRSGRNCCEQVLALTTYVENSFQNKLKSGAVFLDLSAAYDTVWKRDLLLKLAKNLRYKATLRLLEQILSDRSFKVNMNGETSRKRILQNGLPQGSVLSPTLFNVYTADIEVTNSRKFIYADDIGLVAQGKTFEQLKETLNKDLDTLQNYFKNWHLNLNANETTAVAFHLNNHEANRELKLKIGGVNIANEECPRYFGIKLDRALTFRQQLETTKNKIKSRNNIISKLAGTSWGCSAGTLRTSVLSLVYSVAEYCAPVWTRSAHCNKIDVQLNAAMRIVTGTVRSTPTQWLLVLSNIGPPEIRKQTATQNIINKVKKNTELPIYNDIEHHPNKRLKSRRPVWDEDITARELQAEWRKIWLELEKTKEAPLDKLISAQNLKVSQKISELMCTVFNDAKRGTISAWSWPSSEVAYLKRQKLDIQQNFSPLKPLVGELQYINPPGYREMLQHIVIADIPELKNKLKSCILVSLRVDCSVDRFEEPETRGALGYYNAIKKPIEHYLPWDQILPLISSEITDGTSINVGEKNGLWALLTNDRILNNMPLMKVWCAVHRSALAWKELTANVVEVKKNIESCVSIATYFHQPGLRTK